MGKPGEKQRAWSIEERTAVHLLVEETVLPHKQDPWKDIKTVWNHAYPPGANDRRRKAKQLSNDYSSRGHEKKSRDWHAHILGIKQPFSAADKAMRARVRAHLLACARAVNVDLGDNPLQEDDGLAGLQAQPALPTTMTDPSTSSASAFKPVNKQKATGHANSSDDAYKGSSDGDGNDEVAARSTRSMAQGKSGDHSATEELESEQISGSGSDGADALAWMNSVLAPLKPIKRPRTNREVSNKQNRAVDAEDNLGTPADEGSDHQGSCQEGADEGGAAREGADEPAPKQSMTVDEVIERFRISKLLYHAEIDFLGAAFPIACSRVELGKLLSKHGSIYKVWLVLADIMAARLAAKMGPHSAPEIKEHQPSFMFEDAFSDPWSPLVDLPEHLKYPNIARPKTPEEGARPFLKRKPQPVKVPPPGRDRGTGRGTGRGRRA